jgi:hypothetical protein
MVNITLRFKITKYLLIINVLFWLGISIFSTYLTLSGTGYSSVLINILLFLEVILCLICYIGVPKQIRLIYLLSLVLSFGNTVLSLTDQVDLSDVISFIISGITFGVLVSLWKPIMRSSI